MRIVGALLFIVGALGVAWTVSRLDRAKRPTDVALAALAPLLALLALLGLVLALVPGFLG